MTVGLFFGSFNPIHNGHLAMALFLKETNLFDEIWMVVSPNNPLKENLELADATHRLKMVQLAIQDLPFLKACDVEFSLPLPSYTIETLRLLHAKYPNNEFSLLLGTDNIENFHKWKNYEEILNLHKIYVYPRGKQNIQQVINHQNIIYIDAPLLSISATEIRTLLQQKKPLKNHLPHTVIQYIQENGVYYS
jgi:nicotinate-nucleotide adenylyltransferase